MSLIKPRAASMALSLFQTEYFIHVLNSTSIESEINNILAWLIILLHIQQTQWISPDYKNWRWNNTNEKIYVKSGNKRVRQWLCICVYTVSVKQIIHHLRHKREFMNPLLSNVARQLEQNVDLILSATLVLMYRYY